MHLLSRVFRSGAQFVTAMFCGSVDRDAYTTFVTIQCDISMVDFICFTPIFTLPSNYKKKMVKSN